MKDYGIENDAFLNMQAAAKERLHGKAAESIAANTGISWDGAAFCLSSLGRQIKIHYPSCDFTPAVDDWHQLVILHYMDLADGAELAGRLIPFGNLPDGMVRGGGFDRDCELFF